MSVSTVAVDAALSASVLLLAVAGYLLHRDVVRDTRSGGVPADWVVAFGIGLVVSAVAVAVALVVRIDWRGVPGSALTGGVLLLAGVAFLTRAAGNVRGYRRFGRAAGPDVVDADRGRVALAGTVERDEDVLRGPFSGDDAVAYTVRVVDSLGSRRGSELVHEETRAVPFVLEDGTARIRVDPADAALRLDDDVRATVGPAEVVPDAVASYLRSEGVDETPGDDAVNRTFVERNLAIGDDAVVVGRGGGAAIADGDPFTVIEGALDDAVTGYRRAVVYGGVAGVAATALGALLLAIGS